jgi:hypothetical protein
MCLTHSVITMQKLQESFSPTSLPCWSPALGLSFAFFLSWISEHCSLKRMKCINLCILFVFLMLRMLFEQKRLPFMDTQKFTEKLHEAQALWSWKCRARQGRLVWSRDCWGVWDCTLVDSTHSSKCLLPSSNLEPYLATLEHYLSGATTTLTVQSSLILCLCQSEPTHSIVHMWFHDAIIRSLIMANLMATLSLDKDFCC